MMITGKLFRDAVISGANNISNNRLAVDELNVFPVPDGDTGTNMSMTIGNALAELKQASDAISAGDAAKLTASAMLRGARGNSGVILSLIFRGLSKGLAGQSEADAKQLSDAFKIGVDAAYKSSPRAKRALPRPLTCSRRSRRLALWTPAVRDFWLFLRVCWRLFPGAA